MPDPREALAVIKARADSHHSAASGTDNASARDWADKPHRLVYDLAGDSRRLVAALTAVLDLHYPIQDQGGPVLCAECLDSSPTLSSLHPCVTVNRITQALEGGSS